MKFYLKPSDSNSCLIMGKLYDSQFSDGRFVYSTKERIDPKHWKNGKATEKKSLPELGFLNDRLTSIKRSAEMYILLNRRTLTKEKLKDHLDSFRPKEIKVEEQEVGQSLNEHWLKYLVVIKGTLTNGTFKSYRTSYRAMEKFLKQHLLLTITPEEFGYDEYQLFQNVSNR